MALSDAEIELLAKLDGRFVSETDRFGVSQLLHDKALEINYATSQYRITEKGHILLENLRKRKSR